MVLEITVTDGITYAHCPCHQRGAIILDARHVDLDPGTVRGHLLELIGHAHQCLSASSVQAAQVQRLLAERHPVLP